MTVREIYAGPRKTERSGGHALGVVVPGSPDEGVSEADAVIDIVADFV